MNRHVIVLILSLFLFANYASAQSVAGTTSGSASYCSSTNTGFVSLSGYVGSILAWQTSTNSGASWVNLAVTAPTISYTNIVFTTWYRAIVQNGSFPPDTSTVSIITIYPPAIAGTINGGGTFCVSSGTGVLTLSGNQGNVLKWEFSDDNGVTWDSIINTSASQAYSSIMQPRQYRVIVSNSSNCPADTSAPVYFFIDQQTVPGILNETDTVCTGLNSGTLQLSNYFGDILGWKYSTDDGGSWQDLSHLNDTLSYQDITQTIWYKVRVKNGVCNEMSSNQINLTVELPPLVDAGNDATIIQYKNVVISGSGGGSASWLPVNGLDNPYSFTPTASPVNTTTYTLTAINAFGCTASDSVTITVEILIPSAITPNGDGVNDFFVIDKIKDYPSNSLVVFDRWGARVFSAAPYNNEWHGTNAGGRDLPDDIYYYEFDYGDGAKQPASGYLLIKR